jgi:hypothetical protein
MHHPANVLKVLSKTNNYYTRLVGLKEDIWTRNHLNKRNVSDLLDGEFITSHLKLMFDVMFGSKYGQPYIKDSYMHLLPPHLGSRESGRSSHFHDAGIFCLGVSDTCAGGILKVNAAYHRGTWLSCLMVRHHLTNNASETDIKLHLHRIPT